MLVLRLDDSPITYLPYSEVSLHQYGEHVVLVPQEGKTYIVSLKTRQICTLSSDLSVRDVLDNHVLGVRGAAWTRHDMRDCREENLGEIRRVTALLLPGGKVAVVLDAFRKVTILDEKSKEVRSFFIERPNIEYNVLLGVRRKGEDIVFMFADGTSNTVEYLYNQEGALLGERKRSSYSIGNDFYFEAKDGHPTKCMIEVTSPVMGMGYRTELRSTPLIVDSSTDVVFPRAALVEEVGRLYRGLLVRDLSNLIGQYF